MPIDNEKLREGFKDLSTRNGGSLLREKKLLEQNEVAVFFGLGGLGCRTVNAIKASTSEKLDNSDRRIFLCVDTDHKEMGRISKIDKIDFENPEEAADRIRGCIEEDEKHALYREAYRIKTLEHDVDEWLNRTQLGEVLVDNNGAQAIRQIGRVMLMAKGNYAVVYKKLEEVLNRAKKISDDAGVGLKVYIVAGISGGTGSGTVVDFTYMVRKVISGFPEDKKQINAFLFTPDVQETEVDDDKKVGLKANFYAAIKEIDFYLNNKARGTAYKCPYDKVDRPAYREDIFDSCTLVSRRAEGIDISLSSNGVIKRVADAISLEISGIDGKTEDKAKLPYSSFFNNVNNTFRLWWPGNTAGQGLDIPDWAPSRYSSLAYSSFYVPRDELIAYCANMLMEKLSEHWLENDIKQEEIQAILNKFGLVSNRSFANALFVNANATDFFDVEKAMLPVDGLGPLRVRNCVSYLESMRDIAIEEGSTQRLRHHFQILAGKQDDAFVKPIISLVDKAFTQGDKGPVYAINLLSARHADKTGILPWISKLAAALYDDVTNWELELEQIYNELSAKATRIESRISIDAGELNSFTNECRAYGEDLLKCKLLKAAEEYLAEIFEKLNNKNHTVFQIYTYAFTYLIDTLQKDSAYVTDTHRKREGQITTFSFDIADFQKGDPISERFKAYFKGLVSKKNMDRETKNFVNIIFGGLKEQLDPPGGNVQANEIDPKEVIKVIREYFNTCFTEFTNDVVEKFCVVAYSDIDATPDAIDAAWSNPAMKEAAINAAAEAIRGKVSNSAKVMLSCADSSRDVQGFCSYDAFVVIPETKNINEKFSEKCELATDWSEFIGFKRIFGFPINILADLDEYKKAYDSQAQAAGVHLDEKYSADDGFGDWRYTLPEPYNYKTARLLGKYKEGGKDTTEKDKETMTTLLGLAKKAKALGLLKTMTNDTSADEGDGVFHAEAGLEYYALISSLIKEFDVKAFDSKSKRAEIYSNLRNVILAMKEDKVTPEFFAVLEKAGYKPAEPTEIQWTFTRPEFNVMQNRTDFGDDVDFGNFIVLIRSNPYWAIKLKRAVDLFSGFHDIYSEIIGEFDAAEKYKLRMDSFMRAIRVGRVVPVLDGEDVVGFNIKISDKAEEDILYANNGFDAFDNRYLLYLCFVEKYMGLEGDAYDTLQSSIKDDYEDRVDSRDPNAGKNVKFFHKATNETLTDAEYLGNRNEFTKEKTFVTKSAHSTHSYALPNPLVDDKDIKTVILNLETFYKEIRDYLVDYLPKDVPPQNEEHNEEQHTEGQTTIPAVWDCVNPRCLKKGNTGKFCPECGSQPPVPATVWDCTNPRCLRKGNTGKFCPDCGDPAPTGGKKVCPECGNQLEGKFCPDCGVAGV